MAYRKNLYSQRKAVRYERDKLPAILQKMKLQTQEGKLLDGQVHDASTMGICLLLTEDVVSVCEGTQLLLRAEDDLFTLQGQVIYKRVDKLGHYRIGLQFNKLDESVKFLNLIESLRS